MPSCGSSADMETTVPLVSICTMARWFGPRPPPCTVHRSHHSTQATVVQRVRLFSQWEVQSPLCVTRFRLKLFLSIPQDWIANRSRSFPSTFYEPFPTIPREWARFKIHSRGITQQCPSNAVCVDRRPSMLHQSQTQPPLKLLCGLAVRWMHWGW